MSCCGNNNYYSRSCQLYSNAVEPISESRPYHNECNRGCSCNNQCNCNNNCSCNSGCSCNNSEYNDCAETCCGVGGIQCLNSLKESLCRLVNQKAIISSGDCRVCVIIAEVCDCFVKAINFSNGRVLYFNMNRIDSVEDILP